MHQSKVLRRRNCAKLAASTAPARQRTAQHSPLQGFSAQEKCAISLITPFGAGGKLMPADGTSQKYLDRVGKEEHMIVHYTEPFESNAKVWGFNLLSSDARLAASRTAIATGKKAFTRRLNLLQGLIPAGSVNGVYFLQQLLLQSLEETYTQDQLDDISIFFFDNDPELNGKAQLLAAYGTGAADAHFEHADKSIDQCFESSSHPQEVDLTLDSTNMNWQVIVTTKANYNIARRTWNPELALSIGFVLLVVSTLDRWLGQPRITVNLGLWDSNTDKQKSVCSVPAADAQ